MALKPDRNVLETDISFFCNDTTASRGGVMCISTVGSGAAMDQAANVCTYKANSSGAIPVGVLMQDVVNLDLTRQHANWHKDEVQTGSKVCLGVKGWVVTDRIYPGTTPTAGQTAYVGQSGYFTPTQLTGGEPVCGRFMSTKNEDGFARVNFNLPELT